jgi:cytoskeletal protein RodZ
MPETVGQRLKKAREEKYLTLEKVAEQTRIRATFLKALEADDYSVMPSAAQGRGFLRNYAEFLSINIDEVIAELHRGAPQPEQISGPLPEIKSGEMEVPRLTEAAVEQEIPTSPLREFFAGWKVRFISSVQGLRDSLASRRKSNRGPETESVEPPADAEANAEPAPSTPAEGAPASEAGPADRNIEAGIPFLTRLGSLFKLSIRRRQATSSLETPVEEKEGPSTPAGPGSVPPPETSRDIFAEIGRKLRERREMLSLTIDEVERHTHMRSAYLYAIEEGRVESLPSPVQTRGMLANYTAFMDLESESILLRFADALQAQRREKYSETPREMVQSEVKTSMPILRSFIAGDLIFGMVMIASILALSVWGITRVLDSEERADVQSTAPSIVEVLAGTPQTGGSAEETFVPVGEAPLPTSAFGLSTVEAPTFSPNINVVVNVFAVERTYLQVRVDGEVAFEGRIAPRETQQYEAENQVELLTGNGAALRITYNGRDLGLMGDIGEVVSRVYTIAGAVTPTSTIPPTPTVTLPTTPTPTPTPTLTQTPEATSTP